MAIDRRASDEQTALSDVLIAALRWLARGEAASPEALAKILATDRKTITALVPKLTAQGVVQHQDGRLRFPHPLPLLSEASICAALSAEAAGLFKQVRVLQTTTSTNDAAKASCQSGAAAAGTAWLAEQQSAGRGRLDRAWFSPFAANIYMSAVVAMPHEQATKGFSLAVGIALARALLQQGVLQPQLKWPNDLLAGGKKLGGILIELTGHADVVVGIGMNVRMPAMPAQSISQDWTDLAHLLPEPPSRNLLVAEILNQLTTITSQFTSSGLTALKHDWQAFDALYDCPVVIKSKDGVLASGVAKGIDDAGAFRLATDGGLQHFHSGDVSLRRR